ncbi:hypothetical protein D3C80_1635070 [compost metagenome]
MTALCIRKKRERHGVMLRQLLIVNRPTGRQHTTDRQYGSQDKDNRQSIVAKQPHGSASHERDNCKIEGAAGLSGTSQVTDGLRRLGFGLHVCTGLSKGRERCVCRAFFAQRLFK